MTKSVDNSTPALGDDVTFTIGVTNTGPSNTTGVVLTDPIPAGYTYVSDDSAGAYNPATGLWSVGALANAESKQLHLVLKVAALTTSPQVVTNAVSDLPDPTPCAPNCASVPALPVSNSSMSLVKTADVSGVQSPAKAGDVIRYGFTATNTGNTTLTGVSITDALPGLSPLTYTWPGTAGVLTPGQKVTATATYALKQADIDAGHVANTATGAATPPGGGSLPTPPTSGTDTSLGRSSSLSLVKTADVSGVQSPAKAGDLIRYGFTATNTGNTTLTGVAVTDPLPGLSPITYTWPGAAGVLAPGQQVTGTATYALKQVDIDAGHIANTATGAATPPGGGSLPTPPTSGTDTSLGRTSSLSLVKTADASGVQSPARAGDVITYHFALQNTGNTTLTGVAATDPLPGLSPITYTWPGAAGVLAPGQQATGTATYAIKQADIDAGHVANTATGAATPPGGGSIPVPPTSGTDTALGQGSSLSLVKTADVSGVQSPAKPGDLIRYGFTATNTGNTTLTGVSITDALPGLSPLTYTWPGAAGVLAPGQQVTATATYALKQADIDAGHVTNTATGAATPPGGGSIPVPPTSGTDTSLDQGSSSLSLVKTADASGVQSPAQPGDVVRYGFTATNTGNTTLTGVSITDALPGLSALTYTWPGAAGVLAPGQQVTATATYALTPADIDAGHVVNTATGAATPPGGGSLPVPPVSGTDTSLGQSSSLSLVKTADASGVQAPAKPGDVITYHFALRNTGNTTLTGVAVTDPLPGLSAIT
ncbi:DUF11 domain-containing protein, partial [Leifsonia sp. NPDC077715]|uniref:DUF11 domain-containing protein n=1 Tax=Leifsonia sp. NPDC077715 TaxID=3155539 RepID=UPI00342D31DD